MCRLEKLEAMKSHPMNGKLVKKLNKAELQRVVDWITENNSLNDDDYILKVNRFDLDVRVKPKNSSTMWAILLQCK